MKTQTPRPNAPSESASAKPEGASATTGSSSTTSGSSSATSGSSNVKATLLAAALLGIGFMAAIDEIIFHQVLAWHHFVETDSSALALASDGLLHTLELIALIAGGAVMLRLHETRQQAAGFRGAGFLLGMGGFQLFDGIVDHKILGLHQVRYVDNLLPYDIAWNAAGVALLLIGFWLYKRAAHGKAMSQR